MIAEASSIGEADFERLANRATDAEYPIYPVLIRASGLEADLGGPQAAEASLHALMAQWRRQSVGTKADMPKLIKTAIGEESGYGLTGLGASSMLGMTLGLYGSTLKSGEKVSHQDEKGALEIETDNKSVKSRTEIKGKVDSGLEGTLTTNVDFDFCPDPDGKVNVKFVSKARLTKSGSSAGANLDVSVDGNLYYDDNAKLTDRWDAKVRIEHAAFNGKGKGSYVDASWDLGDANPGGEGKINRASSQATDDDVKVVMAQQQIANLMSMAILHLAQRAMEDGKCVELKATSTPAARNGVDPSTPFSILAEPRSKIDGQPTGGTVTATLSGKGALDPANSPVKADATFAYTAPDKEDEEGTVSMVARSKRGIGKASLSFDTKKAVAYFADGGLDAYHGTGTICDFSKPFEISGSGVFNKFVPNGPTSGSYSYKGNIAGFSVWGDGTYRVELKADGSGGLLFSTGPGSVLTPMGVRTATETERYELTPAQRCK